MTTTEIVTLCIYGAGLLFYLYTFFIQRAQIKSLKETTDQLQKFVSVFDMEKVKEYVKVHEDTLEMKKELWAYAFAKDFTDKKMETKFKPMIDKHFEDFKTTKLNEHFNELGWFIIDFLLELSESDAEKCINNNFPSCGDLLRQNMESTKKWREENPNWRDAYEDESLPS